MKRLLKAIFRILFFFLRKKKIVPEMRVGIPVETVLPKRKYVKTKKKHVIVRLKTTKGKTIKVTATKVAKVAKAAKVTTKRKPKVTLKRTKKSKK